METDILRKGGDGNTRPEITSELPLRVLVDWVSCTFTVKADFDDVKAILGLSKIDFEYHDWGNETFQEHIRFSNIKIQRKNDFTYQLNLSGQGCREFETLSTYDWIEVIAILREFTTSKFTRLDLAIDDFHSHYDVARIRDYVLKGFVVTRLGEWTDRKRGKIQREKNELIEDSFYLGSLKSRLSINFYDKKLERDHNAGQVTDGSWDSWTRTELRLKREYADQTADMMLMYEEDLGRVAMGILKKNIRFVKKKSKSTDTNVSRKEEAVWWSNFVGKVGKLKFTLEAPDRTIEKSKEWYKKSIAPMVAAIYEVDSMKAEMWMDEMIAHGRTRLNEKHGMMISQARAVNIELAKKRIKHADKNYQKHEHEEKFEKIKKSSLGQQGF